MHFSFPLNFVQVLIQLLLSIRRILFLFCFISIFIADWFIITFFLCWKCKYLLVCTCSLIKLLKVKFLKRFFRSCVTFQELARKLLQKVELALYFVFNMHTWHFDCFFKTIFKNISTLIWCYLRNVVSLFFDRLYEKIT